MSVSVGTSSADVRKDVVSRCQEGRREPMSGVFATAMCLPEGKRLLFQGEV